MNLHNSDSTILYTTWFSDTDYTGTRATVAGWGATAETAKWSCTLLEAEVPVLSNDACRNTSYNATKIKDVMMCAGYPETAHIDACTVSVFWLY